MSNLRISILLLLVGSLLAADQVLSATISSNLAKALQESAGGPFNIILNMCKKTSTVLDIIKLQNYPSRRTRLNTVASKLKSFTRNSQQEVLSFLSSNPNLRVRSFWATNKISVKGADSDLIQSLANMPSICKIDMDTITLAHTSGPSSGRKSVKRKEGIQWSLEKIGATELWRQGYTGAGVVVGNIDSGVHSTHANLRSNHREEYGWFDAREINSPTPSDPNGHGTFVMGIATGTGGIGVAPGAQWMACQTNYSLTSPNIMSEFLTCGEWMLCPTRPDGADADCSKAPHVISNSWGVPPGNDPMIGFFDEILDAWYAAGIISVFANGNEYACNTSIYPANTEAKLIAAGGAVDVNDAVAEYVSGGPGLTGNIKPDISSPGTNITSASSTSDSDLIFFEWGGTSSATPHVAGVIALLLTNGTELSHERITKYLYGSAIQAVSGHGKNCGGIPETVYPNNIAGWGRVSATGALALYLADNNKT